MEIALKAHFQKKEFMHKLLTTEGSPMRNLGKPSDDGNPYIDLEKSTFIIGVIGLNEAVEFLIGKQLHENEEAARTGMKLIAHMYRRIHEFKKKTGLSLQLKRLLQNLQQEGWLH